MHHTLPPLVVPLLLLLLDGLPGACSNPHEAAKSHRGVYEGLSESEILNIPRDVFQRLNEKALAKTVKMLQNKAKRMSSDDLRIPFPKPEYVCSTEHQYHQTNRSCNTCKSCCRDFSSASDPEQACVSCHKQQCMIGGPNFTLPSFLQPTIHYSPNCLWVSDWHDIAGAMTHRGLHHLFFGCNSVLGGWHHAVSDDLVHFAELPGAPRQIEETAQGMESYDTPCSGFVTLDDDGIPCAGFRQCGSEKGYGKGAHSWDVPMEVRCAQDVYLTKWGDPEFLFEVSYYRPIPYDPARPWIGEDGSWYMLVSTDACNETTKELPCMEGGSVMLYRSDTSLRGHEAEWQQVGEVYKTPDTVLKNTTLTKEMVTIDYIGALQGDPHGGSTRIFFNNVGGNGGGNGCCSGTTSYTVVRQETPDGMFLVNKSSNFDGVGMVDWGAFPVLDGALEKGLFGLDALGETIDRVYNMARTLGSEDSNQVLYGGRKVMFSWMILKDSISMISLGRDLSLDNDLTLLQAFVPELKGLRNPESHVQITNQSMTTSPGMHAEIYAEFTHSSTTLRSNGSYFGIKVFQCDEGTYTIIGVDLGLGLAIIDSRLQGRTSRIGGPLAVSKESLRELNNFTIHAYIDGGMIEMIVNNRTALSSPAFPNSQNCGKVSIYGLQTDLNATVDVWSLETAN